MHFKEFQSLYAGLNPQQKEAVDRIEGPVMVIAGPGTGKTQILATRILNILEKTDTRPDEILCLTYTESGAFNMKQRLASFMGTDAYKVNIHTFHGLCNKIIRDFPDNFAYRDLRLIEDIEKIDILNEMIRTLPKESPLKSYAEDPAALRRQLSFTFSLLQEEGHTIPQLAEWIGRLSDENAFREAFPDRVYKRAYAGFQAGEIKKSKYDELIHGWTKLLEAAHLYENYKARKKELGVFEFSDMIEWVSLAFENDPELLLACQEQYQYVLVDEYQDTSGVQNHILLKLISFWKDNPNCFVVGDDDQSIYAFQGARVDNMKAFADQYSKNIKTIVLTSNYRSSAKILLAAEKLIENNQNRLVNTLPGLSKKLSADGPWGHLGHDVEFRNFSNRLHEAVWLADELERLLAEGVQAAECAVIYPKHKNADELSEVLKARNIPFVLAREIDILQEPLIRELLGWLRYTAEELEFAHKGEYLLYEILLSPLYHLSPYDVAVLSSSIYEAGTPGKPVHWRDYFSGLLNKPIQTNLFENDPTAAIRKLWQQVETWLSEASMMNVPQLIEFIYSRGGFLGYALGQADRDWCLEVLACFLRHAQTRNTRTPFMSLKAFLEEIDTMIANGIVLPLEKQIGSGDGVILTTAHRSKGLEFDHVFIISADQDSWEKDRSNGLPFKIGYLFKGLNRKMQNEQDAEEGYEEKRRLFYVAMTRAKKKLTITRSNQKIDSRGTKLVPSQFVVETEGGISGEQTTLAHEHLANIAEKMLAQTGLPKVTGINENWLQQRIERFVFSPTTLYTLFECGIKFYYTRLVNIPQAPNASAGYGSAMHDALAEWVKTGTADKDNRWPGPEALVSLFEKQLYRQRGKFSENSYRLKLQQGRDILPDYFKARIPQFSREKYVVTESRFQSAIDGVEIKGFTDKLIFHGNDVVIVDYKSGNPTYAARNFRAPTEKDIENGKLPAPYWFQVGIYHLLIEALPDKKWRPVMGMLDLLDKDENGEFQQLKMTYSTEDLELLRGYIREGRSKLNHLDFLTGCGSCEWCEFARQTGQVIDIPVERVLDEGD